MDSTKQAELEALIQRLIVLLDGDHQRDGLRDTPARVARSYAEMLNGYERRLENEITLFDNQMGYDDLVYSGHISYFSICEHHLLPFFGTAHMAYVPDKKIVGLSKLARAVEIFAHRLTDQETITTRVAAELDRLIAPKGVILYLSGQHLCNIARGVKQAHSTMKTVSRTGVFVSDPSWENHFYKLISVPDSP
jgi:GTP cyclohydrolase IA